MKQKRVTLIFPGQGSQYEGMGKEFHDNYDFVRDIYNRANEILGYDLADMCFTKRNLGRKLMHLDGLHRTIHTQPAVLTTAYACFKVLEYECTKRKIELNVCSLAGHSLGEYTALLVSRALDLKTSLDLVNKRATYMTELGKGYPDAGLMAVVDKRKELDYSTIEAMCKDFQVYITLNNTRKQIVVGGSKRRLGDLSKELKNQKKVGRMLKVEGPFHTPLMKPAADRFKKDLDNSHIYIATKPIIANVSTDAIVDPNHIRKELYDQIFNIVDWRRSVEKIITNASNMFIEVGPGMVLKNMIKDIAPSIPALNVEDMESLERAMETLSQ